MDIWNELMNIIKNNFVDLVVPLYMLWCLTVKQNNQHINIIHKINNLLELWELYRVIYFRAPTAKMRKWDFLDSISPRLFGCSGPWDSQMKGVILRMTEFIFNFKIVDRNHKKRLKNWFSYKFRSKMSIFFEFFVFAYHYYHYKYYRHRSTTTTAYTWTLLG